MSNTERLINSTFSFIKELLKKNGEFFPVASAIQTNDSVAQVGTYDGNERPLSDKLISDFKTGLRARKEDYQAIAIFYDVRVIDPNTNLKTDAVAVFIEAREENSAQIFYYPYLLNAEKQLIFSEPWKNAGNKEIFTDEISY